jgi:hypothetical protein
MEARGLEWGKPLSEPANAPAQPLQPGWNVVKFPKPGELLQAKLTNSYIRSRCVSLDRDWWSLWELLQELPGGADTFGPHFGTIQRALDNVWNKLVEMRMIEEGRE